MGKFTWSGEWRLVNLSSMVWFWATGRKRGEAKKGKRTYPKERGWWGEMRREGERRVSSSSSGIRNSSLLFIGFIIDRIIVGQFNI